MPAGRPTDYRPQFEKIAKQMCELGATDAELAAAFDVNTTTIWRWQSKHPKFCNALRVGKEKADARVERSLYHRAVGYTFDAVKIFMPAGANEPVYAPYSEHVPPEFGSMKLWLVNRQGEKWRDKREHQLTGKDGGPIEIAKIERIIVDPVNDAED